MLKLCKLQVYHLYQIKLYCVWNSPKISHFNFGIFHQFVTCLVTLFDRKLQVFKNSPNWPFFGTFNELLSNKNENDVLAMLNDFFCDFQTPWQRCFFGQDMLERWVNPRHLLSSFDCRENSSTTYLFSPILSEQWNKPHVVSRFSSCQTARGSSLMGGGLPLPRNLPLRHKLQGGKNAITTRFRLLFSGH